MLKREVEPFILNIFTFNSKFGPFKSWGHQFYVKIPTFLFYPYKNEDSHILFFLATSLHFNVRSLNRRLFIFM